MKKNSLIAIILILALVICLMPLSKVQAEDGLDMGKEKTEYQEEKSETDSISDINRSQNLDESKDAKSVIQPKSDTVEIDVQESTIEKENDDSQENQEESSIQNAAMGDYTYSQSNGKITITKYYGTEEVVEIPAEFDGIPVTSIGTSAFQDCEAIRQLTIPDGITKINTNAFSGCKNLEELYYNCSLTSIGTTPFLNCSALKKVYIGEKVSDIAINADNNCYGTAVETFVADENNSNYVSNYIQ